MSSSWLNFCLSFLYIFVIIEEMLARNLAEFDSTFGNVQAIKTRHVVTLPVSTFIYTPLGLHTVCSQGEKFSS